MVVVAGARLTILGLSLAGGMSTATPSDLPLQQADGHLTGSWASISCFPINVHRATGLALSTPFQHL